MEEKSKQELLDLFSFFVPLDASERLQKVFNWLRLKKS